MAALVRKAGLLAAVLIAMTRLAEAQAIEPFFRIDDRVALGGQPEAGQVAGLAGAGFRSILDRRE